MGGKILCSILLLFLHCVAGNNHYGHYNSQLCDRNNTQPRSCTTQILGKEHADLDSCKVEYIPPNSTDCTDSYGPITSNEYIGGVILSPYILSRDVREATMSYSVNYTVLNITFTNIKWKTMKFRFQKYNNVESHCRNIAISNNVKVDDQSVLYYDCYWSITDGNYNGRGQSLDFEATDDAVVNRGSYLFNIPSAQMLSTSITERDWKPFVYIEIMIKNLRLHIMPPPRQLKITSYQIQVKRKIEISPDDEVQQNTTIKLKSSTQETLFECSLLKEPGLYYFVVTPIHEGCKDNIESCQNVESPKITISIPPGSLNVCIASVTALVVATLFAYYILLRFIRKYWCKDYSLAVGAEIPPPTKVLVIYPSANRLHAECVASFVTFLRSEYGLDVMYDGDISSTSHGDPYVWAAEAIRVASHVVYIVGPAEETNLYNSIYDKPIITAHKDVDILLLSLLRTTRLSRCQKDIMNVFFEHSNGQLPIETRHDKVYFLLTDWQKLISHLSRYLLPKKQIMRTEKGRSFLEDLTRAKKLLGDKTDDVVIRCEKMGSNEKKVLL